MGLNSLKLSLTTPTESFVHATPKQAITIGRSLKCDFNVPKEDLSREHCLIEVDNTEIFITDLGSKNGISINRAKISPHKRYLISNKDEVLLSNKYLLKLATVGIEIKSKLNLVEDQARPASPKTAAAETVTIELEAEKRDEKIFAKNRPPTSLPSKFFTRQYKAAEKKPPLIGAEAIKMLVGFLLVSMVLIYSLIKE